MQIETGHDGDEKGSVLAESKKVRISRATRNVGHDGFGKLMSYGCFFKRSHYLMLIR